MFSSSPKPLKVPAWVESIELVHKNRLTGFPYSEPRVAVKANTDLLTDAAYGPIEVLYSIERNGDVINRVSHRIEERVFACAFRTSQRPFAHTVAELWDIDAALKRRAQSPLVDSPALERLPVKPLEPYERAGYVIVAMIAAVAIGTFLGLLIP